MYVILSSWHNGSHAQLCMISSKELLFEVEPGSIVITNGRLRNAQMMYEGDDSQKKYLESLQKEKLGVLVTLGIMFNERFGGSFTMSSNSITLPLNEEIHIEFGGGIVTTTASNMWTDCLNVKGLSNP